MTTPITFAIQIIRLLSNIQPVSKLEFCRFFKASGKWKYRNSRKSGFSRPFKKKSWKSGLCREIPAFKIFRHSEILGNPDFVYEFQFSRLSEIPEFRESEFCRGIPTSKSFQNSQKSGLCREIPVFENLPIFQILYRNSRNTRFC